MARNSQQSGEKRSNERGRCCSGICCCVLCVADTLRWIPVLFISAIVAWSYYAYTVELCFYAIDDVLQRTIYLVFYHICFVLFVWSYGSTIFTDPGSPHKRFYLSLTQLEQLTDSQNEQEEKAVLNKAASNLPILCRQVNLDVRYCKPCTLVKPDRCHHCSICRKCVLKMDHHCPWVNNCVGFHNYKFFILFLFYATVYCLYVTLTDMPFFVMYWQLKRHNDDISLGHRMQVIFLGLVAAMFILGVLSLLCYHIYLLLNNKTTIESFRVPIFIHGTDEDAKRGFGIGWKNNFVQVFGTKRRFWILPVSTCLGNGNSFPVADCEPESGLLLNDSADEFMEQQLFPPDSYPRIDFNPSGRTCPMNGAKLTIDDEDDEDLLNNVEMSHHGRNGASVEPKVAVNEQTVSPAKSHQIPSANELRMHDNFVDAQNFEEVVIDGGAEEHV
ncbi:palmitoyltransferase ZDHHC20-B-like [Symsagittifera roscoffensis]|uniref:palmitoyltransferase ZDHHC20-B-like n=1 Tax=Symsagittifera roscoffensis TaxID=84072 RepID=UPI00307C987B